LKQFGSSGTLHGPISTVQINRHVILFHRKHDNCVVARAVASSCSTPPRASFPVNRACSITRSPSAKISLVFVAQRIREGPHEVDFVAKLWLGFADGTDAAAIDAVTNCAQCASSGFARPDQGKVNIRLRLAVWPASQ
jgi:hypothetical protein